MAKPSAAPGNSGGEPTGGNAPAGPSPAPVPVPPFDVRAGDIGLNSTLDHGSTHIGPNASVGESHVTAYQADQIRQIGNNNIFVGVGSINDRILTEAPLEEKLRKPSKLPDDLQRAAPDDVAKYADMARRTRLLAICGYSAQDRTSWHAAFSVIEALAHGKPFRVFECRRGDDVTLDHFVMQDSWRKCCRDSVVLIDKRRDMTLTSLDDDLVAELTEAATEAQCVLIILLTLPETATECRYPAWIAGAKPAPANPAAARELADRMSDPLESVLLLITTIFPGLGASEFASVVNAMLPPPQPTPPLTDENKPPAEVEPSTLACWRRGERDDLIAKCGLNFGSDPDAVLDDDTGAAPGYMFSDAEMRMKCHAFLFGQAQQVLTMHFAALTEHYFLDAASERFCAEFRTYVLELDTRRIMRITSAWLMTLYSTAVARVSAEFALRRFIDLLRFLADQPGGKPLIGETLKRMSADAQLAEAEWQFCLLDAGYDAAAEDANANLAAVFSRPDVKSAHDALSAKLSYFFDMMIAMASLMPAETGDAICDCIAGSDSRMNFATRAGPSVCANLFTVPSVLILEDRLVLALRYASDYWIVSAQAVMSATSAALRRPTMQTGQLDQYLLGGPEARRATAYMLMLQCCLNALRRGLEEMSPDAVATPRLERLFSDDTVTASGELVADVMARHAESWMLLLGVPPRARRRPTPDYFLMYTFNLYEAAAVLLTSASEEPRGGQAMRTIREFISALGERRHRDLRRMLLQESREVLEREHANRRQAGRGDWKEHARATTRLHGMQNLLNALKSAQQHLTA